MNSVGLDGAGDVYQILVDHRYDCRSVFLGEIAEDLIELLDVVRAVVGRKSDSCEQYLDLRIFKRGDHGIEIAARLGQGKATKSVISTEFDDDDRWMHRDDRPEPNDSVLAGGAARSFI